MRFGKKKRQISRLLIVEDEPLVAFDTEHFLQSEGFEIVATVDRVAEALSVIAGGRGLDLVLVDMGLSDGNGIEVARAARARSVDVLFVTGNCPMGAIELAAGCLSKPYSQRDLLRAIGVLEAMRAGVVPKRVPASFRLFPPATA